ncbi:MAG: 3-phosphoshikimate 1-carboxyvinyltransferase [Syntrophobacteraceae bacterium]|nr:3-phosphoshikimate 1-carboxyvinyltransferase [Syntrophobacteraceae bacterium]
MNRTSRKIEPVGPVKARVRLPGSKSVTHRALLMAALADGPSEISNALSAEDTHLTAKALRQLGTEVDWGEDLVRIVPARQRWVEPAEPIYLGNSGTSTRLLLAIAAAGKGRFVFDGTERLRERPIGPVLDALETLGVRCRCLNKPGYPPVEIISKGLSGGRVLVDARQSSQFLSALLIAAPCAAGDILVEWLKPVASFPYVELTLAMMKESGIEYRRIGEDGVAVPAPRHYRPLRYTVEGDCSSASYFWAAAALCGGEVFTYPVYPDSRQGDCRLLEILETMGCRIDRGKEGVTVTGSGRLKGMDLDMNRMPDMVPTVAVLAAFADGQTRIGNVAHLRIKESDRLHTVAVELAKFGVPVRELPDGLIIEGGRAASPAGPIETYEDHRLAMAFAVMGLRVAGVRILGAEAVAKSFPGFWDHFNRLGGKHD